MEFDSDAIMVGGRHTELAERVAAAGSGQLDLVARRLDEIEDGVADSTVARVEWNGPVHPNTYGRAGPGPANLGTNRY
jgi:hypothetical protein